MTWQQRFPWLLEIPVEYLLITLSLFLLGIGIGALVIRSRLQKVNAALNEENTQLNTRLEIEHNRHQERLAAIEDSRHQLQESFLSLSQRALKENNDSFLRLANENLKQFQQHAESNLDKKEKAVETLVKPIQEALQKTEQQIQNIEKERIASYSSLAQHLKLVAESQHSLRSETRNLVQALRRPEVRGQWGEMTLKRLAELSGMVEHCDFVEQEHRTTSEGAMRPDMIVRMPDSREIIVDAKTPLDAYLSAMEASDDEQRDNYLAHHARKVRERMKELASKAYWTQFKNSPDFVVLFIPGDQFLSAALEHDPALLEDALNNKVILATPTSLIALLRAVAFGWRQMVVAENAEKIRDLGEDLYKRVVNFTEHLIRMGKSLGSSVDQYNKAIGSLEHQVLPGARKFTELGIHTKKEITDLEQLDKTARMPANKE